MIDLKNMLDPNPTKISKPDPDPELWNVNIFHTVCPGSSDPFYSKLVYKMGHYFLATQYFISLNESAPRAVIFTGIPILKRPELPPLTLLVLGVGYLRHPT